MEVCNPRILGIVERIKVEIAHLPFRCLGDVFPDQICELLIEELVDVLLSFGFKDATFPIVVHSVQFSNHSVGGVSLLRSLCRMGRNTK